MKQVVCLSPSTVSDISYPQPKISLFPSGSPRTYGLCLKKSSPNPIEMKQSSDENKC